jgi:hypothetical protein
MRYGWVQCVHEARQVQTECETEKDLGYHTQRFAVFTPALIRFR